MTELRLARLKFDKVSDLLKLEDYKSRSSTQNGQEDLIRVIYNGLVRQTCLTSNHFKCVKENTNLKAIINRLTKENSKLEEKVLELRSKANGSSVHARSEDRNEYIGPGSWITLTEVSK